MKRQKTKPTPSIFVLVLALTAMAAAAAGAQDTSVAATTATAVAAESSATTETAEGLLSSLSKLKALFPTGVVPTLKVTGAEDDVSLRKAELRRLLSAEETTFIYDHANRRDPMLLPWTHYRYTASKEIQSAERAYGEAELDMAQSSFEGVLRLAARMEASGFRLKAMTSLIKRAETGLRNISSERKRRADELYRDKVAKGQLEPELPKWVKDNTEGILFSSENPMCLVGPFVLGVGELVPLQPVNVRVEKIDKLSVTYYVSSLNNLLGKSFVVSLEEGE